MSVKQAMLLTHPSQRIFQLNYVPKGHFDNEEINRFTTKFNIDIEHFKKFIAYSADVTDELTNALLLEYKVPKETLLDAQKKWDEGLVVIRSDDSNVCMLLERKAIRLYPNEVVELPSGSLTRIIAHEGSLSWGATNIFELIDQPGVFYKTTYLKSDAFALNTDSNREILNQMNAEIDKINAAKKQLEEAESKYRAVKSKLVILKT